MADVNRCSWPEVSQVSEDLQLNSIAAKLEHILARFARLESRLVEHERRVAATHSPLRPEPDPPDAATLYTAAQPPFQATNHQPCYTAKPSPTLHPYYQPARQPDNGWEPVSQPRYSTFGYPPWQPEYKPSRLPYSGTNLHIQQRIPEAGYHPWQPEYRPPSPLPANNTPTMVFGEDVSDGIVPNNATHNVGTTLDVPNDKFVEEIVKNVEESPQVLVEATTEKNMVYDDKNLPQVSILLPLLNRDVGSLPIRKEVMEILFQDGFIMFGWISGREYIQSSGQAGHRGIGEGRRLTIRCAFDPGGESLPKLLFVSLFVVSWFPP